MPMSCTKAHFLCRLVYLNIHLEKRYITDSAVQSMFEPLRTDDSRSCGTKFKISVIAIASILAWVMLGLFYFDSHLKFTAIRENAAIHYTDNRENDTVSDKSSQIRVCDHYEYIGHIDSEYRWKPMQVPSALKQEQINLSPYLDTSLKNKPRPSFCPSISPPTNHLEALKSTQTGSILPEHLRNKIIAVVGGIPETISIISMDIF
jgi:hypothetical protein